MNLEIIVAAGYDTPGKLAGFLMLDHEEQTAIYNDAAAKSGKAVWVCDVTQKKDWQDERHNTVYT